MMSIAALALVSCSAVQKTVSSDNAASLSGQQCATATNALYKAYKTAGKIDLSSTTNVSNILVVATAYNQLKANKGDASYRKAFTKGAVAAGTGLITAANAETFTNTLLNSTGLGNINTTNIKNNVQTAGTIITLLNTLKQ